VFYYWIHEFSRLANSVSQFFLEEPYRLVVVSNQPIVYLLPDYPTILDATLSSLYLPSRIGQSCYILVQGRYIYPEQLYILFYLLVGPSLFPTFKQRFYIERSAELFLSCLSSGILLIGSKNFTKSSSCLSLVLNFICTNIETCFLLKVYQ
jgi:hypothetical protein